MLPFENPSFLYLLTIVVVIVIVIFVYCRNLKNAQLKNQSRVFTVTLTLFL